jgi:DNA-directed RNA polymerase specialized sigma24 family protein
MTEEQRRGIEGLLAELPLSAQEVVLLHDDQDLTFQEIADTLHEPLNTVKSRYRRALLLLRHKLTKAGKKPSEIGENR